MAARGISGLAAGLGAAGLYLMYAGIRDVPIVDGLRELANGRIHPGRAAVAKEVKFSPREPRDTSAIVAGAMVRPVEGATGDGFGAPRPGGRKHLGLDIIAPAGRPIHAARAGKVVKRGYDVGAGNHVNLRHPDGMVTKYFHMSRYEARDGADVGGGQVIGYVGSTGHSSGPHLHFEVWVNGVAVDPAPYLAGAGAGTVSV